MASSIYDLSSKLRDKITDLYHNTVGWFISSLFKNPSSILFLGIDNAGKTTLVNLLKNNAKDIFLPTKHAKKNIVEIGNLKAQVIDIGGHEAARVAWKDYFYNVDGIVFIVDVNDVERYKEVAESWRAVLDLEKKAPILVFMNKIDAIGHTAESIELDTGLKHDIEAKTAIGKVRNPNQEVNVKFLSILSHDSYIENKPLCDGFSWLSKVINNKDVKTL
jgi:GTP-binding protein SAR1